MMLVVFLTLSLLTLASRTQAVPVVQSGPFARYMFYDLDSNKDGISQLAELKVVFNRYDKNSDGQVSRAEYVTYQERAQPGATPMAHFLFFIFDVDNDGILEIHDYQHLNHLTDLNGNGYVSRSEFIHLWTLIFELVKHLIPEKSAMYKPGPLAKLNFDHADTNNDNFLQRTEMWVLFNHYDSNGDGRVSRAEYVKFQESVVPGASGMSHYLFYIYDVDHDHMLDAHDYEHLYRLMDLNGNGRVSRAEFISLWTAIFHLGEHLIPEKSPQRYPLFQPGPHAKRMFDHADSNNDNMLQRTEMWVVFKRYDSNGDGRVSRREYVAYQEAWASGTAALAHYLFSIYDMDDDDMLDSHDYDYFYHLMDWNGMGYVSRDEFVHFWTKLLESVKHLIPYKM